MSKHIAETLRLITELAGIERPLWNGVSAGIPAWHPRNEGDDEAAAAAAAAEQKAADDARLADRLKEIGKHKKAAEDRAKALEEQVAALTAAAEKRESENLPELDRERKAREQAEQRLQEAEKRAEDADKAVARTHRERWVSAAAKDFTDPSDAVAFLNLDDLEDESSAQRAVKDLAKSKPHLLKTEGPVLPGRLLENGLPASGDMNDMSPEQLMQAGYAQKS